jgi:acyl carrier protein
MSWYFYQFGGPVMTIGTLTSRRQTKATHEVSSTKDVRTIIADHLGVDVKRVTDEAHFTYDLGAGWLDRLELMIVIEDQFPTVEITDDDVDQMDVVGDLIRHIAGVGNGRRRRPIIETPLH